MSAQNAAVKSDTNVVEIVETVPSAQIRRMHSERPKGFARGCAEERDEYDAYKQGRRFTRNLLRADCLEKVFGEATGDRAKMLAVLETL